MTMTRTPLDRTDPEFHDVYNSFMKTSSTKTFYLSIEAIEKVQNDDHLIRFDWKKYVYKQQYGHVKVVKVFHGTKRENIPSILKNNFDISRHGQNTGHRFGAGVSFSALANYACHYCDKTGIHQMLLCYVLVSNITEVPEMRNKNSTILVPPFIEGTSIRYDTTAKNKTRMDVIVKFERDTFYPAFVIHFRKNSHSSPSSGTLKFQDISVPSHSPEELETSVPSIRPQGPDICVVSDSPESILRSCSFNPHRSSRAPSVHPSEEVEFWLDSGCPESIRRAVSFNPHRSSRARADLQLSLQSRIRLAHSPVADPPRQQTVPEKTPGCFAFLWKALFFGA